MTNWVPDDAVKILISQLDRALKAIGPKPAETRYEQVPEAVKNLIDQSKQLAQDGELQAAISVLNDAVNKCPNYSRGRLQVALWQYREENLSIALFSAGHAYHAATDTDTKCQVLSLAGDIATSVYEKSGSKHELVQAITFYEHALKQNPAYPHPAWNMIEAKKMLGEDFEHEAHRLLAHIVDNCGQYPGLYTTKLKTILKDWDNVLGDRFGEWRREIERLAYIEPNESAVNVEKRNNSIRRVLVAAALAAGIATAANEGNIGDELKTIIEPLDAATSTDHYGDARWDASEAGGQTMSADEKSHAGVKMSDEEVAAFDMGVDIARIDLSDDEVT